MAEVTGFIGSESVELNNAATEATLKKLLASLKTLNQSVIDLSGKSGGAGAAAKETENLTSSITKLNPVTAALSGAFSLMGSVVGGLMNVVGATAGAITGLADKALDGSAKMSDFYGAVSKVAGSIPLLGGVLGPLVGLFQKIAEFQERNMEMYQQLTNTGVNFGGSLTTLRMSALKTMMTLDEFTGFISKNSNALARLGGGIDNGAKAFVKLSSAMFSAGEPGSYLLALGYTTEQVNQGMASYIEMSGYRNSREVKNTQALIDGSAAYMEELDGLARITGKSREEQEETLKAASKNAAWQAMLAGMDEKSRAKAMAGMANALALGGKGAVDAFQSKLMGVAPDKAGAMFIATADQLAGVVDKSADMVKDGSKNVRDMSSTVRDGMRAAQQDYAKYGKEGLFAIIRAGGPAAESLQQLGITANTAASMTDEQINELMAKKDLDASQAEAMAKANLAMKSLGEQIMLALSPVIAKLTPYLTDMTAQFAKWVASGHLEELGKKFGELAQKMMEYMKYVFSPEGRDKIVNDLKYYLQLIMIEIKKAIIPWYSESDAAKDTAKLDAKKDTFDKQAELAKMESERADKLAQIKIEKDDREKAKLEADTAKLNSDIDQKQKDLLAAKKLSSVLNPDEAKIKAEYEKKFGGWGDMYYEQDKRAYEAKIKREEEIAKMSEADAKKARESDERMRNTFGQNKGKKLEPSIYESNVLKAATGGLFSGPREGYNVLLHGNEMVIPMDKTDQATKTDLASNAIPKTSNMVDNVTNNAIIKFSDHSKTLVQELQALNKHTAEMLKHMKETADHTKQTVSATRALNGNLFPH